MHQTKGVHHVGLTVQDLAAARGFFVDTLGYDQIGEKPDYPAFFLSDGETMLTLWQAKDPGSAVEFDRHKNVGLHHLALRVDKDNLDALAERVAAHPGVEIEFAPEPLGKTGLRHMMLRIPRGPRLELVGV